MIEKDQVFFEVCQEMAKNFADKAVSLNDKSEDALAKLAEVPGIFAVLYNGRELGLGLGKTDAPEVIYVGDSAEFTRHMVEENTGNSGLRRSLAAMLATAYDLKAVPRSDSPDDIDKFENYALDAESEAKLSAWMKENLLIASLGVPADEAEKFIQQMVLSTAPVFNLRNNTGNRYCSEVKRYRRILTDAAKATV